ncbi:MAG: hypothetical protein GY754_30955 [bacterium]|nr:hypothetical protein [bacterium]
MKNKTITFILIASLFTPVSCSIKRMAINMVADSMSSGGDSTVFTGDDDPQLIGDALPFALKMYEILLEKAPDNIPLHLTTGKGFIVYANAFVHTPASMLPDGEFKKKKAMLTRAKKLYIRGRNYLLKGLELKHPGFNAGLKSGKINDLLKKMTKEDVAFLYWTGSGWMAAYSVDAFDVELGMTKENAVAMLKHALKLDESFGEGSIHDFFVAYYGSLPPSMGGSEEKARLHFARAVKLSKGKKASPYVGLATSISIKKQDVKEFTTLLEKALEIDVDADPKNRLANIITQQKAQWFLDHKEDKFLLDDEEDDDEEEDGDKNDEKEDTP